MPRPEPGPGRQGWGLVGGSWSLGAGITGGLPELLLELKACLPVGLKQLLEAGVEVVILLLQVVQTGIDLVQHGVDGSIFWKEEEREPRSCISPGLTDILPPSIPQPASKKALASPYSLSLYHHLENEWISKEDRLWRHNSNTLAHHVFSRVTVVREISQCPAWEVLPHAKFFPHPPSA